MSVSPSRWSLRGRPLYQQMLLAMVVGAVIGISLNLVVGTRNVIVEAGLPEGWTAVSIEDRVGRTELKITRQGQREQRLVVDPAGLAAGSFRSWEALRSAHPEAAVVYDAHGGTWAASIGNFARRFGNLFLRMLQMVSVPLIVTSLITGVMGLSGHGVGRMFRLTITYYLATSMLAIVTGLAFVNLVRPGLGSGLVLGGPDLSSSRSAPPIFEVIFAQVENVIPANPLGALVEPNFLSIIAFTIAFAIFAMRIGGTTANRVQQAAQTCFEVIMAMTHVIIRYMPIGVFLLMLYVTATQGYQVFGSLGWYMLTVALALAFHACVSLPLIVRVFGQRSPFRFARDMSPALMTAFSTASSNGTLPLTMSCVEERAGISNRTGSFVLPLGATINMDGTALYEAVAVLFIAQIHFGENLPLAQQVIVALTALVASVGAAGIPHAGLVMMVIVLQAVGLPIELQGIILAVDRMLDMARTTVNVWSDACGCAVVEKLENRDLVRAVASDVSA